MVEEFRVSKRVNPFDSKRTVYMERGPSDREEAMRDMAAFDGRFKKGQRPGYKFARTELAKFGSQLRGLE